MVSELNTKVMDEITEKLAEQLAKDLDKEILEAIKKDSVGWKVQRGNVVYSGPEKKIYYDAI